MNDQTTNATGPSQRALVDIAWRQVEHVCTPPRADDESPDGDRRFDRRVSGLPEAVPGYHILGEIHRGGQGVVYRAMQESTNRTVALKVMLGGAFAGANGRARFAREIQVLGELRHPHIVTIHDSGTVGDSRYFVMDYVDGWPLDRFVEAHKPSLPERLRLFAKICAAVNAAHLRGVIHRDLKPGNIRVDPQREPRVLDFGLAKLVREAEDASSAPGMTLTGQFVGSLPWASPEQARGRQEHIDLRTDVYSLGVVLYQLLTGAFPYDVTGGLDATLRNIVASEPLPPRRRDRTIHDDLEAVVLKALHKEPEQRYETAGALGRDVERYLAGEPVSAKRDSFAYVLRKQLARHRVLATVSGTLGLAVLLSTVLAWVMFARASQAAFDAGRSAQQARNSERSAKLSMASAYLTQAREMRLRREPGFRTASLKLLSDAAAIRGSDLGLRNEAIASIVQADLVVEAEFAVPTLMGGRSSDVRGGCIVSGLHSGEFLVRRRMDETADYHIPPPEEGDERGRVSVSPDGRYLVGIFQKPFSHGVRLFGWDVAARRWLWQFEFPEDHTTYLDWDFDPDGRVIAVAHPDGRIRLHKMADGRVSRELSVDVHASAVQYLRVGTRAGTLLLGDRDKPRLVIYELANDSSAELPLPSRPHRLKQSADGRWLAVACTDLRILVYRVDPTGTIWPAHTDTVVLPHAILSGHVAQPTKLAFAEEGGLLITGGDDTTTRFWDLARGVERFAPAPGTTLIGAEGNRIVVATRQERQLEYWRADFPTVCQTLRAAAGRPAFIDERYFAIGGNLGLSVWDAYDGSQIARVAEKSVTAMHVSESAILLATKEGLERRPMQRAPDGPIVGEPTLLWKHFVADLCLTADESTAFVSECKGVWRVPLDEPSAATFFVEHLEARAKSLSPDGERLAVGNWMGDKVGVYSVADGSPLFDFSNSTGNLALAVFTPRRQDGNSLLIISTKDAYHFLDAATYAERHSIPREGFLPSLAVSPDGATALITRTGGTPVLIDLHTFETLAELTLPESNATLFKHAFDPTGTRLVMTTNNGTAFVWDLAALRAQLAQLGLDWR